MKIKSFEFAYIKSFKSLRFDLEKTSVLIGQNDHGKSSILKAIDMVLNRLNEDTLELGALHPDLAEQLLPIFPVNAKARRITINYESKSKKKQLYITVRTDLTFTVLEKIERNAVTTPASIQVLKELRKHNRFILIPALRDATSPEFQQLFSKMLREYGLSEMIPQKAGGTPKEYRTLKGIRDQISKTIKPYIDEALLPQIERNFGFKAQHKLALKFAVDVEGIGEWILDNLRLGFQMTDDGETTLALSEAGSGVQSGVLLALHRLEQKAVENPDIQFILAVEEPEAFLHPQKQKELYQDIRATQLENLKVIVTTHSPYVVAETPFDKLGLVKKAGQHSELHVPTIRAKKDLETFDAYGNEVNTMLFFADKVVFVEGESDARVLRVLLEKKFGTGAHRISIISAAGNQNFSPFLRMVKAWNTANIPHLVVTDFDSLIASADRPILRGAKDAGYTHISESALKATVDSALDKTEVELSEAAISAGTYFKNSGLNVFVFTSDLEFSLITDQNKIAVAKILSDERATSGSDYSTGYSLLDLKKQIGSKGVSLSALADPKFKKPYIHRKIAETIDLTHAHQDLNRLLKRIEEL
ncbi:ATP-dependent endonuclease [Pontiella sp.]|uniref:ATP-dependent nuclease n=1 Tax=Pontiella sp. TaxID=2837462 RepID=UPI003564FF83